MYVIWLYLFSISAISTVLFADVTKSQTLGAECECLGKKGKCVSARRCLTTLDTSNKDTCSNACENIDGEYTVCCTDCTLVNDTRNAVLSPFGDKILWKDGRKSRDQCLDYLSRLPYKCREGNQSRLLKNYDVVNQCHNYKLVNTNVDETPQARTVEFPFQARLGFVKGRSTLTWTFSGSIITEKFVLTDGFAAFHDSDGVLKYIGTNMESYRDSFLKWSVYETARTIIHPEYKNNYNNIALIETKIPIKFNENVLPICLPTADTVFDDPLLISGWASKFTLGRIIAQQVTVLSQRECENVVDKDSTYLQDGYNHTTHICAKTQHDNTMTCPSYAGEPLVVSSDISPCVSTVVGVVTFCQFSTQTGGYTRVLHFLPWIESIVWP